MKPPEQPTLRSARVRRWLGHLWREWTIESWRGIAPAFAKPEPLKWSDAQGTAAWKSLGPEPGIFFRQRQNLGMELV
jgi:hypothetical protein